MKKKISIKEMINILPALRNLSKQPLKAKLMFRLMKFNRKVESNLKVYQEANTLLREKFNKTIVAAEKAGKEKTKPPKELDLFVKEIEDLGKEEIEIESPGITETEFFKNLEENEKLCNEKKLVVEIPLNTNDLMLLECIWSEDKQEDNKDSTDKE